MSPHPFHLFETMRADAGQVLRLERHLRRLGHSAAHFGFAYDDSAVRAAIAEALTAHQSGIWRLRLTLDERGAVAVTMTSHTAQSGEPWRVAFANAPVDDTDPFLFHKTTERGAYDVARRGRPDVDDVLLWNQRRELTESTIANVVVELEGRRYTPPVMSGLLAGTLRAELLERGDIEERVITRGEVVRAERLWLINSLRGWIDALLVR